MGKLSSIFTFTGSVGDITAYKVRGSDEIIIRKKGGPSKELIKNSPAFSVVRRRNAEFGGLSAMTRWLTLALLPVKPIINYNIVNKMHRFLRHILELDTVSEFGQRAIRLSAEPGLLTGLQLNEKTPFGNVISASVSSTISRENRSSKVVIPVLVPRLNMTMPGQQPFFSIIISLGIVPDLFFTERGYKPSKEAYDQFAAKSATTPWALCSETFPGATLEVTLPDAPPDEHYTLMLCIGIRYGVNSMNPLPQEVSRVGFGEVLMMA